jgi:hypothetical protein
LLFASNIDVFVIPVGQQPQKRALKPEKLDIRVWPDPDVCRPEVKTIEWIVHRRFHLALSSGVTANVNNRETAHIEFLVLVSGVCAARAF